MANKTGRYKIFEQFRADGIRYMFGNPGTVEQGFLDAVEEFSDFEYILHLQEAVAVGVADGYARATRQPTVVQLHSGVGLGNGIGMMYQAKRGHAPLVVIAGEAGMRYDAMDAQMAADLVSMARPVTKWSGRVTDPTSLLRSLRRAIKMAMTPPTGPVFLCLPMDVLDAPNDEEVVPTSFPSTRVAPDDAQIAAAAALLAGAQRPMLIVGDGVAYSGAQEELARVAELTGADVWGADYSEVNIAADNPHFRGSLGHMFGEHSQAITTKADAVLICGTYVFPEVFPMLSGVFAPGAKVIHVDLDPYEIAKNFPVDMGFVADPKLTLGRLASALEGLMDAGQRDAARARTNKLRAARETEERQQREADAAVRAEVPLHTSAFMEVLARHAPKDTIVFDEALTSSPEVTRYLPPNVPGTFFQTRGGSLGVGIPGAIGIKLACPDKTVIGFTGDGGAMYTPQALWTAAHHKIGAKFVVCNNRSYKLLKLNIQQYWRERGVEEHDFPASFELAEPDLKFAEMARSMGVPAVRVERPEEIEPAVKQALADDGPFLIDLVISADVPGHITHVKCGQ